MKEQRNGFEGNNYKTFIRIKNEGSSGSLQTYTVEDAIENSGFGRFQVKLSAIIACAWLADSMEIMVVSILGPVLACEWGLSSLQEALISMVVFLGLMIASPIMGIFADKYGRRTSLVFSTTWAVFYGVLSTLSPLYVWLLILRGLLGLGVGGSPQVVVYYCEFLPRMTRGKGVILLSLAWALGGVMECVLGITILLPLGWRWWLLASAIPLIIFLICCAFVPESPRYDITAGNLNRALQTLKAIALQNGDSMPEGTLKAEKEMQRGGIGSLLDPIYRRTTLHLWLIGFVGSFTYYGVILMSTRLIAADTSCIEDTKEVTEQCTVECDYLTVSDLLALTLTALAELPGLLLAMLFIDWLGRKATLALMLTITSVTCFILFICVHGALLVVLLFIARGTAAATVQVMYVYTTEYYPTWIRSTAIGCCVGAGRFGGVLTPFVATVLLDTSHYWALGVYGCLGLIVAIAAMLMPIETKGRKMDEIY